MLKNYIRIAFRSLIRQKFYTFLNVAGLAIGMACTILILLFIFDELNYDTYNANAENIHRVYVDGSFGGKEFTGTYNPAPLAKTLVADYPEVLSATRFRMQGNFMVRYGDKNLKETNLVYTDTETFEIFSFPFISGDPSTALDDPNTIVITETIAKKYFGNEDPLGKTVILDNKDGYEITGVIKDLPKNSHFNFDIYITLESYEDSKSDMWLSQNYQTYLLLADGANPKHLEEKFPALLEKYFDPQLQRAMGATLKDLQSKGGRYNMLMQPLKDIHLYSHMSGEMGVNGDIKYVYIFGAVALFILLIACINFMNLSTARSSNRAKEVGIRKVLGSFKKQLIAQFLTESMVISIAAFLMSVGIVFLALPYFNQLTLKSFSGVELLNPVMIFSMFAISLLVGFLAGSYPAFFISAFQPVAVLKGEIRKGAKSGWLRSTLVVFQFATSIILIVGTIVVYTQLQYIQNKKVGYDKDQVVLIKDTWLMDNVNGFKEELKQHPNIINTTASSFLPIESNRSSTVFFKEGEVLTSETTSIQIWRIDVDYVSTLGMEIVKGRNFSEEFASDSNAIMITESCVKQYGLGENPIGKRLGTIDIDDDGNQKYIYFNIVGVVKDFNFESLHHEITPVLFRLEKSTSMVSAKIMAENVPSTLEFIEAKWNEFAPGQPFEYSFMNEDFNNTYKAEQRIGNIFTVFSGLAIFIGCLGLLGLAAFTAEQRTKEIGIRKTLGATISGIVLLLLREFGILLVVSFVVAAPIAYFTMNSWLEDFVYRIDLGILPFVLAGLFAFIVAIVTVSFHAIKAASSNPVDSLKFE
ncbi:MAG: ABC transporter permease [Bacteroidetes bacterium]|nr:ABC transporter permease [Bacteroidota bacterium]